MRDTQTIISAIIPIRNEEHHIGKCIESLLRQNYPADKTEILLVDGNSTDRTRNIVQHYCAQYPHLRLVSNPDTTVPYALNIGIRASLGHYILILGAHSEYTENYFSKCVDVLEKTGADSVGGVVETRGLGFWGKAISLMQTTSFGVGNAYYRIGAKDGYVDTVPFGAYRRELFDKYGLFDVRLTRNQDNEMYYRIRKNGGKIYLSNDINLIYYCRSSLKGVATMALQNSKWTIITSFLCPGSMSLRHFIPLLFVLSLLVLGPASLLLPHSWLPYLLLAETACYSLLSLGYSFVLAVKNGAKYLLPLILLYPLFHLCYGAGSLAGFLSPTLWEILKPSSR